MEKGLEYKKQKNGRWIWLITTVKGKVKKTLAQPGKGVDYSTKTGAGQAVKALRKTLNELV